MLIRQSGRGRGCDRDCGLRDEASAASPWGIAAGWGGMALEGLRGSAVSDRFRAWRGRSGRRYVFSVYPAGTRDEDLPLDTGAVALLVAGPRACPVVLQAVALAPGGRLVTPLPEGVAVHLHLLATDSAERAAILCDLDLQPGQATGAPLAVGCD